jgi:glycosyltransferase involved in cell wall biosynthesis
MPKVSVLMPVYNAEKFLREAIDSILSQCFVDFEFLIINDGSTDSSEAIILGYNDLRIRYIKNEVNQGIVYSRNKGLKLALGEYIASMDADDVCMPERLEKQVSYMDKNKNIGLCGTSFIFSNGKKNRVQSDSKILIASLSIGNCFGASTVMIRKEVLIKHSLYYNPEYSYGEDYDLWLQIARHTDLGGVPEVLIYYRVHPVSITYLFTNSQRKSYTYKIRIQWHEWIINRTLTDEERIFLHDKFSKERVVNSGLRLIEAVINSGNLRIDLDYYLTTTASRYEYNLICQYKTIPLFTLLSRLFFSPLRKYSPTSMKLLVKMLLKQVMS